ncbi:hypothetical protein CAEBREN_06892 [Caenorhabditis brenneri]|uniref:SPK domain-containing protein n=1 Tax=Caenorhabditis brenneri TaxID=135651 RepID=G0NBM3_CAEBE|nr:hypothetical protein CAEBREN_06892 [Caenorhabditis brenneri]
MSSTTEKMTKPPQARVLWTDETDELLVNILEEAMDGRTAPFEIMKIKEELVRRTGVSMRSMIKCFPIAIERYLKDPSVSLEMRIRMAYFAKASVPMDLQNEMQANGVANLINNKLKKFVSSNPSIASVPEGATQLATKHSQVFSSHVTRPSNYASSNGANAQMSNSYHGSNAWNYPIHSPYVNSSAQHLLPQCSSKTPLVPGSGQSNIGYTGFDGSNAGSFPPQNVGNFPGHSQHYSAPNHFGQEYYMHPSWTASNDSALYDPPGGDLLDLDSFARQPNGRDDVGPVVSTGAQAHAQDMAPAPPNSVLQSASGHSNSASVSMMPPSANETEGASNSGNQMAASFSRGLKEPAQETPPINNHIKTEIKQEPNGIVASKKRGAAEGDERRSKKSRAEESAKVGLPTPSRTSYQFMYDFLQCFEGFKTDNKFIKEFIQTLLDTTMARKDYLEKKVISIEVVSYIMDVAFSESIQKAKDLELEDDVVVMETEQISLKTFLLKLKNLVNCFIPFSPALVSLAEKMDKVLEGGVKKNGVIVDAGKLGVTAMEVIECLKFAKSTCELIPEL